MQWPKQPHLEEGEVALSHSRAAVAAVGQQLRKEGLEVRAAERRKDLWKQRG